MANNFWEIFLNTILFLLRFWPLWAILIIIGLIRLFFNWRVFKYGWHSRRKFWDNQKYSSTPEARRLGELLGNYGWKVELEKWDGYKHIDIAITEAKVNIEVDGKQHNLNQKQALRDLERTYYSFRKGYVTLRIPNVLVRYSETIETTAQFIY